MAKNPSLYNPKRYPERTKQRRDQVFVQMVKNGMLTVVASLYAHFEYQISDAQGKIVDQGSVANTNGTSELELPKQCSPGTYLFTCEAGTTKFTLQ